MTPVCESCHEVDRIVIKCSQENFEKHQQHAKEGNCEICGKRKKVALCHRYGEYIMSGGAR